MEPIKYNQADYEQADKSRKKKFIFWGVGLAAVGALSFFGLRYYKKHKQAQSADKSGLPDMDDVPYTEPKTKSKPKAAPKPAAAKDAFPLKKGSKGANVKALQEAILAKYGKSYLPKYGADGDFGSELVSALKKAGLPATIDQNIYNVLTAVAAPNPAAIASELYNAASAKNHAGVIAGLKKLRNVNDYKTASTAFQNYRLSGGVRQTLVNGLLSSFASEAQKQGIRMEFSRMGLKYDPSGDKWSLAGLPQQLITTQATQVWKNPKTMVSVPVNMVLGMEMTRRGAYSMFENDGLRFLVKTEHVRYY